MKKLFLNALALMAFSTMTFASNTVEKTAIEVSESPCTDQWIQDLQDALEGDGDLDEANERLRKCMEDNYGVS